MTFTSKLRSPELLILSRPTDVEQRGSTLDFLHDRTSASGHLCLDADRDEPLPRSSTRQGSPGCQVGPASGRSCVKQS